MSKINNYVEKQNFFNDPVIYCTNDAWGNILVIDHKPYRILTFDSQYEQSSMNVENPHFLVHEYTRAMMLVLAFMQPAHVTILGLGGGCLLRSLHSILPSCELHAVELRLCVYEVTAEFFGIPVSNKIQISIADAKQYLRESDVRSTDIILADMYNAYGINPYQMQVRFIHECYRVLSNEGWLVINYHELAHLDQSFFKCIGSLFAEVFICNLPCGNNILFASKYKIDSLHQFDLDIKQLEKQLQTKLLHLFRQITQVAPAALK